MVSEDNGGLNVFRTQKNVVYIYLLCFRCICYSNSSIQDKWEEWKKNRPHKHRRYVFEMWNNWKIGKWMFKTSGTSENTWISSGIRDNVWTNKSTRQEHYRQTKMRYLCQIGRCLILCTHKIPPTNHHRTLQKGVTPMGKFYQCKKLEICCTFGFGAAGILNYNIFFWTFLLLGGICFVLAEGEKWKPREWGFFF